MASILSRPQWVKKEDIGWWRVIFLTHMSRHILKRSMERYVVAHEIICFYEGFYQKMELEGSIPMMMCYGL